MAHQTMSGAAQTLAHNDPTQPAHLDPGVGHNVNVNQMIAHTGSQLARFWISHNKIVDSLTWQNKRNPRVTKKTQNNQVFVLISDSGDEVFCPSLARPISPPLLSSRHSLPDSVHLILIDPE